MSLGFTAATTRGGAAMEELGRTGVGGREVAAPSVLDQVELRAGELWSGSRVGAAGEGVCIRVLRGVVWVTQEGDLADYVLRTGEVLTLRGGGLVVAEAMEDARLMIRPASAG